MSPIYNGEDFLAQRFEGDLAQKFRTNWSWILLAEDDESHGHCLHI